MSPVTSLYGAPQMAPMITETNDQRKTAGSCRFSRNTMALEIIQEYEEREAELGLGKNNFSPEENHISTNPSCVIQNRSE